MKVIGGLLAGLIILNSVPSEAAVKSFAQKNKFTVIRDGVTRYEYENRNYDFRVEVVSDDQGLKYESLKKRVPFITAQPGERYSIRLYNPLPVSVVVNLAVDGLNSISGKPTGIEDGGKWKIEPNSFIVIPGWQVNSGEVRRFFFTEKPKTYAAWRGTQLNKDLSVNCGVIGAAYFWNSQELQQYFDSNPTYHTSQNWRCRVGEKVQKATGAPCIEESMSKRRDMESKNEQAGTGMGERQSHPTYLVDFHYDAGMYKPHRAVVLYYDFEHQPKPNPFPNLSYAPEMP